MKLKLNRAYVFEQGKTYEIVTIWKEDDARPPDRERIEDAWRRIVGGNINNAERTGHSDDRGDWVAHLYRGGWVAIASPEGGAIGVLVEAELEND